MKKNIITLMLIFLLSLTIVSAGGEINRTGVTIDFDQDHLSGANPKSHANSSTSHYILTDNSAIYQYDTDFSRVGGTLCASSGWEFIGHYNEHFLMRIGGDSIRQLNDSTCGNVATRVLGEVTGATDITLLGEQLFVLSNDSAVYVYRVDTSGPFNEYLYLYKYDISGAINMSSSFIVARDDYNYILDGTSRSIYRYDKIGGFIETFDFASQWPLGAENPNDLYFYNDTLFIIEASNDQGAEYDLNETVFPDFTMLGGVNYSREYCVDTSTLCTNTTHTVDILGNVISYCESANETFFCSAGCVNSVNNTDLGDPIKGVCSQLACENECNIINDRICSSPNTFQECGDFDADACLEYGLPLFCPTLNGYCTDDIGPAVCEEINTSLYSEIQPSRAVVIETLTDDAPIESNLIQRGIEFVFDYTIFAFADKYEQNVIQTFLPEITLTHQIESNGDAADYFTAIHEEYAETVFFNDDFEHADPSSHGWTGTYTFTDGAEENYIQINNQIVTKTYTTRPGDHYTIVAVLPEDTNTDYEIRYYADGGDFLGGITIAYQTDGSIEFYLPSLSTPTDINFYNDTGTTTLKNIYIKTTFLKDINSLAYELQIVREVAGVDIVDVRYSYPIAFLEGSSTDGYIEFESPSQNDILRVRQVDVIDVPQFPIYQAVGETGTHTYVRVKDTVGCEFIRAYAVDPKNPSYHFYADIENCIARVDGVVSPDLDPTDLLESFDDDLSEKEKIIISLIAILIVAAMTGVSYAETQDKATVFIGAAIMVLVLVALVILGLLPGWIIALMILIAVGIVALLGRNMLFGNG